VLQILVLLQDALISYCCTLIAKVAGPWTAAIVRHMSFALITCLHWLSRKLMKFALFAAVVANFCTAKKFHNISDSLYSLPFPVKNVIIHYLML